MKISKHKIISINIDNKIMNITTFSKKIILLLKKNVKRRKIKKNIVEYQRSLHT